MKLTVHSFTNGEKIPGEYGFCIPAEEGHVTFGGNKNPHLTWEGVPAEAKSLALICVDISVPSKPDNVNQEGKTVPKDLPRVDFYHWVLVDLSTNLNEIKEGSVSNGVTPRGKETGRDNFGVCGINNYTDWFKGDENMEGFYGGYDGPCPPWNDELVHEYHFKLFALDVETLGLEGNFTGGDALEAMQGHILAEDDWKGTYTLNKDLL